MKKTWSTPTLTKMPGRIKRLSPSTSIVDTTGLVREYIKTMTDRRGPIGHCIVVYVRYGARGNAADRYTKALAAGPTLESVLPKISSGKSCPAKT